MKALVGAFNQEKALVGAFFVIVQPVVEPMEHYTALSRTASDKLTGTFTANAAKYRTIIDNARTADGVVREKLASHMDGIRALAGGEAVLAQKLPRLV